VSGAAAFVPGNYWSPEAAAECVRRMTATFDSPEFQVVVRQMESGALPPAPEGFAAQVATVGPIDGLAPDKIFYRRAVPQDVPRIVELIVGADLPPMFIEEFLGGFCVADYGGEMLGCGGNEIYGDCAVIRSIVVDGRVRGAGIGRRISELLIEDSKLAGASDLYLFTADAHAFWLHLGFVDVPFEEWREEPRACWQYRFLDTHRGLFEVHTMWKRV
jgi:N-acetylglutamate synthase-like GNAT family acetyltransferase